MSAQPRPLRGTQVLLQRLNNQDEVISELRARLAQAQETKRERRWWVTVRAFRWHSMTHAEATAKLKECADVGFGEYAAIVEDP